MDVMVQMLKSFFISNWKTTILGAVAAIEIYQSTGSVQGALAAFFAGLIASDAKLTHAAPAQPKGDVLLGVMALALCFSLTGCALFKTSQTTTVTTGPEGGCVSSTEFVPIGKTGVECNSVCISNQTGAQITCRPIAKPEAGAAMVLKTAG